MSILPISNIINVTVAPVPAGITEKNVNSIAIFTNEQPDSLNDYEICTTASQVAELYGTNSVTTAMANAIFAQTPNILSGDGRLVLIPLIHGATSATAGRFVTADISANLANFQACFTGDLKVTVNGTAYNLTSMNFSQCSNLADVASVLQAKLSDVTVTATATAITITSKKVGTASTIALAAVAGGTGTQLNATGYLNAAGGTATAGANSSGETLAAAITRTQNKVGFVGVMSNLNLEDAAILAVSNAVQAQDLLYFQHFSSIQDIAGIITTIQQATNTKTRCFLYTGGQALSNLAKAAYVGRGCSVNFEGSNTAITMMLKSLATVDPDLGIDETAYQNAQNAGADLYVSLGGVPSVVSTGGNDFFDNVYADLALKFYLEAAGFNFLRQTDTKVPQTEQGMNGLKNAYAQIMDQFVRNGNFAPGQWNASDTFGDPTLFKNNITNKGYYIYSLPVALQNQTSREQRKAPLVQIAAKRAGAIQQSDVFVEVNY